MGAAAGKAVVEHLAAAATTQAEDRLAAAEHILLACRGSSSGAVADGTGIWDSEGTCVNGSLLAAVDEMVLLKEIHAFPMASAARRRMDGALRVAMSLLVEQFLGLRVWDASQLRGRSGLRFAVEKLSVSVSLAARGASLAFLVTGGSTGTSRTSTGELSLNTVDGLYASGGSHSAGPDASTVFLDGTRTTSLDELALICPASLSVLHEISLRVIRAGYTEELLHAFTDAPCDVLDRFLSILQVECSPETDQTISFEDAEWWTTEDMTGRWILATKLVGKALAAMKTQLHAQSNGAFDRFKDEYLSSIAKRSASVLLRFADGFTSTRSPEKLIYVLEMYEALVNAVPGLLLVFTGEHTELVSRQVEVVLAKLARALRVMIAGLVAGIRTGGGSRTRSVPRANGVRVSVHPLARYAMTCVESLAPHRGALDVILASTSSGRDGGGGDGDESVNSLGRLVSELVACLEHSLEEMAALCGAEGGGGGGSRHLFLANNTSFLLKHADDAVKPLLGGDEWAARRRSRVDQHVMSYVEASWSPVVACLEAGAGAGKSVKILAKFESALEKAYSGHACCEVPDPALRAALRKGVSEKVVAAYMAYLLEHPRLENSARHTAESLAGLLSELFEGGAADSQRGSRIE